MSRQQERRRWYGMLYRCENPNSPAYKHYGARGIKVCERWHDFDAYYADIMRLIGACPDGRTLDRIDNDGNYEPGNVRWATIWQQVLNSRVYGRPKNPYLYTDPTRLCPHCRRLFVDVARHVARRHAVTIPGRGTFIRRDA